MNLRSVLLSSAAAIAVSSSAWAAQGDTYLSLFGGYSSGEGADILDYQIRTSSEKVTAFTFRKRLANKFTSVQFTTGTTTTTQVKLLSYTNVGTLKKTYISTDTQQFSGSIGSSGWVIGGALGVELLDNLRGEAEAAFRRFDADSGARLDKARLYRRRYRADAYYNYVLPLSTGTFTSPYTTTQKNFLTSVVQLNRTRTHAGKSLAARADGELTSFSLMANLWYDFPLGDSGFTTFIGGGLGVSNLTLSYDFRALTAIPEYLVDRIAKVTVPTGTGTGVTTITTTTTSTTTVIRTANFKDDDAVFAYQFGAGLGYEFDNGIMLAAQYRYFATTDGDFGGMSHNAESSDIIFSLSFPFGQRRR